MISDECSVVDEEINLEPSAAPVASQPKFSGALAARYGLDILRRMREDGGRKCAQRGHLYRLSQRLRDCGRA